MYKSNFTVSSILNLHPVRMCFIRHTSIVLITIIINNIFNTPPNQVLKSIETHNIINNYKSYKCDTILI